MLSCCSKLSLESLPRRFSRMAVLSWSSRLATLHLLYFSRYKCQHNKAFCVPKYCGHHLASRWLRLELWPRGPKTLPNDDSELYSLAHEPKSHLQTRCKRKSSFDIKASTMRCILMLWLPFARRYGIWGPNGLLAYLNDHVRLWKCYHVKCLMPALFLHPEFVY